MFKANGKVPRSETMTCQTGFHETAVKLFVRMLPTQQTEGLLEIESREIYKCNSYIHYLIVVKVCGVILNSK